MMVVLYALNIVLIDVTNLNNILRLSHRKFEVKQDCLLSANCFENINVVLYKKTIYGQYSVCDILDNGYTGRILDGDNYRVISQLRVKDRDERDKIYVLANDENNNSNLVLI